MPSKRAIIVGDCHGNRATLLELLVSLRLEQEQDAVVMLGDLCDRGVFKRNASSIKMMHTESGNGWIPSAPLYSKLSLYRFFGSMNSTFAGSKCAGSNGPSFIDSTHSLVSANSSSDGSDSTSSIFR